MGGCGAYAQRYFFNRFTGDCHEFIFGGCLGNNNNFESKEQCLEYCKGFELDKKGSCSKAKDRGPCEGFVWRYFHDHEKGECEAFIYGGCRGNENNFKTKRECSNVCGVSE
ncbi:hypothetical protein JTE90_003623 [Oedothorax gibbosus]|uniref:BPTI/Kunitz inhibitor domain-containing protein n=1 Tax=Oedothorax gibbosus TaxID=931172 RepID=A0AAV6VDI7_9ARAC|nr:hypothetical protein JTE90_003623 [Oedothorax gibbosus]